VICVIVYSRGGLILPNRKSVIFVVFTGQDVVPHHLVDYHSDTCVYYSDTTYTTVTQRILQ